MSSRRRHRGKTLALLLVGALAAGLGVLAYATHLLRRSEFQTIDVPESGNFACTAPRWINERGDIVGLYLDPPESALVLCVDEMPQARQTEAARGYLRLTNGKAARNFQNRDGADLKPIPANIATFRIGGDGKLAFASSYEIETGGDTQFWSGMVTLS